jgi:hypothetical protein
MQKLFENWRQFVKESELEIINEDVAEYIPGTSAHKMRKAVGASDDDDQDGIENEDDIDHHRERHSSAGGGGILDYIKSGFSKLINMPEKFDQLVEETKNEFTFSYIKKLQFLAQSDQMQEIAAGIVNQISDHVGTKTLKEAMTYAGPDPDEDDDEAGQWVTSGVVGGDPEPGAGMGWSADSSKKQFSLDELKQMGLEDASIQLIAHTVTEYGAEALIESAEAAVGRPAPPEVKDWLVRFIAKFMGAFVFGFIDNFIMVMIGKQLDAAFGGVTGAVVGSTNAAMAAAGLGNTVSDMVGELGSSSIEYGMKKMGLDPKKVTDEQVAEGPRWMRFLDGGAGVIGIAVGCLVGMFPLFLEEKKEKNETKLIFENWRRFRKINK